MECVIAALPFIALLIASGDWASHRFAAFDDLPGHYDFKGRASRLTPRSVMVWLLPLTFSVMLLVISGAMGAIPREIQNGDPAKGILVCGFTLLAAQALFLWLTERWAREQG